MVRRRCPGVGRGIQSVLELWIDIFCTEEDEQQVLGSFDDLMVESTNDGASQDVVRPVMSPLDESLQSEQLRGDEELVFSEYDVP